MNNTENSTEAFNMSQLACITTDLNIKNELLFSAVFKYKLH